MARTRQTVNQSNTPESGHDLEVTITALNAARAVEQCGISTKRLFELTP